MNNSSPKTSSAVTPEATSPEAPDIVLILPSGNVSITEAAGKIFSLIAKKKDLFYRGGKVHEIVQNPDGSNKLDPLSPSQFRSRLDNYGSVFVWRAGSNSAAVLKPTVCPEEAARALLESIPARERLPNVCAMSACPVLANEGGNPKSLGRGWHALGGGLFITGGEAPPHVSIAEAVQTLSDTLIDFEFSSAGDRSRALASLIAPALRFGSWLHNPLPVDIGEADSSQSGKTYRQKLVAAIYRETPNVVVQRSGGVGGMDESLSQKLVDGRPFILFDNLRGKLDSPFLEAILTASGTMPARVPHRGEIQVDARSFVFQLTSNGVETTRDLANRASIIRIRKRPADYIFKSYAAGDLYAHIVSNQPYFLGCVFAVILEWVKQGAKRTSEKRHDFREWSQTLDWIVQNIFSAVPLLEGHEDAKHRVGDPRRTWLRELCLALHRNGESGDFLASRLAEFAIENEILPPNAPRDAEQDSVARAVGKIMAQVFTDSNEVEIDHLKIFRSKRHSETASKDIFVYRYEDSRGAATGLKPAVSGRTSILVNSPAAKARFGKQPSPAETVSLFNGWDLGGYQIEGAQAEEPAAFARATVTLGA